MGKSVLAEGVGHADEQGSVVAIGCDFLHGYFLGSPASFGEPKRIDARPA